MDFSPPQNVKQAMIDAINNGNNFYTRSEGLTELTEAIAKKENAKRFVYIIRKYSCNKWCF